MPETTMNTPISDGFGSNFGLKMVDIFVGSSKQQFRVHKDLLCSRIPYFEKMFREGTFIESAEQAASLPEDDPVAFSLLLEWVYTGRLSPIDISKSTRESGPIIDLIKLYHLAEKICLRELGDYLMTTLISSLAHHKKRPSVCAIGLAYKLAPPGSHLRTFMVTELHYQFDRSGLDLIDLCQAFIGCEDLISDFRKLLVSYKSSGETPLDPITKELCIWHKHASGATCHYKNKAL